LYLSRLSFDSTTDTLSQIDLACHLVKKFLDRRDNLSPPEAVAVCYDKYFGCFFC
jgi:hypothetical protein